MTDAGHPKQDTDPAKRTFGWLGLSCLLLIIPTKAIRWVHAGVGETIIGVAPSILGSSGLLFLILSSSGRLSRLTLPQATILAAIIALALEFAQLLPRPGILAVVQYTFDWLDVAATLASLTVAFVFSTQIIKKNQS